VECGAGAWPVEDASRWLSKARVCSSRAVVGMAVEAEDGAAGRVADLLVDDELWSIDYILVDALPAAGGRQLLVPLDWVRLIDCAHGSVHLRCTRRELGRSPPF
jgi:hypothetical protein